MAESEEREWNVWFSHSIPDPRQRTVFASGGLYLLTTVATLVLLSIVGRYEFNPMGFYVNLIPFGALIVGLLAGSGYGIGSWLTGAKMGRGLLVIVALLQIVAYFAAQYVEFA